MEMADLTSNQLSDLAEKYFAGVDAMDWKVIREVLTEDCTIEIRTHGLMHEDRDLGVRKMFDGLFERYHHVWHGEFRHVCDVERQTVASQFKVLNTLEDGSTRSKMNFNFFEVRDGLFFKITIYMSGENTLN